MYSRSPLQPYDPLIPQEGSRNFNYLQNNFVGAGQDSYTKPFAQSQELFQSLQNIMPPQTATFKLRYGYSLFTNSLGIGTVQRLYSYQNIQFPARKLVFVAGNSIVAIDEAGGSQVSILTSTGGANPRTTTSRDYLYIPQASIPITWPSGQQGDGKKWTSNGPTLSNWGIAQNPNTISVTSVATAGNVTLVSTAGRVYATTYRNSITGHYSDVNIGVGSFTSGSGGPSLPSTVAQTSSGGIVTTWTNPNNIKLKDGADATCGFAGALNLSESLLATGFGFSIPSTATIYGVTVVVTKTQTNGPANSVADGAVQLIVGGTASGTDKGDKVSAWTSSLLVDTFYGGASDTWGLTLTPTIVNAANFGVAFQAAGPVGFGVVAGVDAIEIIITYATGAGANTGAITGKQINLTLPNGSPPPGVDRLVILATLDGGDVNTLYIVDDVPIGTGSYIDNTPDNILVTKNIAAETDDFGITHGVIDNDLPPIDLQFPLKHRGRIYGSVGETLFYSKSLDEVTTSTGLVLGRFEEAWPATNAFDVSTQKETIRGLLSDGSTLYIGTERHVWRLDGDGPLNFSKPEVIYNEVGVLNQDVWQICYLEGQPVGMIWITPDSRVIMGNFAHYKDIGTPIQDVLNTINTAVPTAAWGQFFSREGYDLFILAIPTGGNTNPDTLCVYDLRAGRWYIWKCADNLASGLFNITTAGVSQWLIGAVGGAVYQFLPSATQDRVGNTPVAISWQAKTSWLNLGRPLERKSLNEIEVITNDPAILISVAGASKFSQTLSPNAVVTNVTPTLSPFGYLKVYLAGTIALDHNYQLTFGGNSGVVDVLQGYAIEAVPMGGF